MRLWAGDRNGAWSPWLVAAPAIAAPPTPGLVAAYAFDEGSGTTAVDASGNGHTGARRRGNVGGRTLRQAGCRSTAATTTSACRTLGTFYNTALHARGVGAESRPKNDVGILGTWAGERADALGRPYRRPLPAHARKQASPPTSTPAVNPIVGQWQHLAATYDGTTARYYIDGVQVASRAVSGSVGNSNTWRIGAYGSSAGRVLRRHASTSVRDLRPRAQRRPRSSPT